MEWVFPWHPTIRLAERHQLLGFRVAETHTTLQRLRAGTNTHGPAG
jgi:hypothetical protein